MKILWQTVYYINALNSQGEWFYGYNLAALWIDCYPCCRGDFIRCDADQRFPWIPENRIEEIFDDVPQARGQAPAADYVTRQEYENLLSEHNRLCGLMQKLAERLEGVKHDEPEAE